MIKWAKISIMTLIIIGSIYYLLNSIIDLKREKVRSWIRKSRLYRSTIGFTNKRIMESNITRYFKYYSAAVHFLLAFSSFGLGYFVLVMYPFQYRILLAGVFFLMPWAVLQILDYKMNALTKKQTGDFIISFKEMYYLEEDIFPSFKKLEECLSYPIQGAVEKMNKKYKIGVDANECLDVFKEQFSNEMMQTFVTQISVVYNTGGSVESICDNFLKEIKRIEETEDQEKLNQIVDRYGIYMILIFNILMMHLGIHRGVFLAFVTETAIGQITLSSNYILTLYILMKMIKGL